MSQNEVSDPRDGDHAVGTRIRVRGFDRRMRVIGKSTQTRTRPDSPAVADRAETWDGWQALSTSVTTITSLLGSGSASMKPGDKATLR